MTTGASRRSSPGAIPDWGPENPADAAALATNTVSLVRSLRDVAHERRTPTVRLAHGWHRMLYAGVGSVPDARYLGAPRGSTAALVGYEVAVGPAFGVDSAMVAGALASFIASLRRAVHDTDRTLPPGIRPSTQPHLSTVVTLAAVAHGEWVRIHPYAHGNGRVARVWANWIAMRYGMAPFVRILPRPDGLLYGRAALASMAAGPGSGHDLTVSVFLDMLRTRPGRRMR